MRTWKSTLGQIELIIHSSDRHSPQVDSLQNTILECGIQGCWTVHILVGRRRIYNYINIRHNVRQ